MSFRSICLVRDVGNKRARNFRGCTNGCIGTNLELVPEKYTFDSLNHHVHDDINDNIQSCIMYNVYTLVPGPMVCVTSYHSVILLVNGCYVATPGICRHSERNRE